jgi:GT2 family glycosyltransferase
MMEKVAYGQVGVVVIGRNEGARLERCLRSLPGGCAIVYVDSGSTDDSIDVAREFGRVVELDMSKPFSMARARNAGATKLAFRYDHLEYLFFVDGDCEVVPGWLQKALTYLSDNPRVAAVCGKRRERAPEASPYNALCDAEWNAPCGEVAACGGDAVMRLSAFACVGGFDETLIAGEEPELCHRIRDNGWKIVRLDEPMTVHDAAITSFGQWWRRCIRAGYGGMSVRQRLLRRGYDGRLPFEHMSTSARTWCLWIPGIIAATMASAVANGVMSVELAVVVASVGVVVSWAAQAVRIGVRQNRTETNSGALSYGIFTMIAKVPQLIGQFRFSYDYLFGKHAQLIEYKQ